MRVVKQELFLLLAMLAGAIAYGVDAVWLHGGQPGGLSLFLVVAIVLASMRVAHHAELLAEKVGDPYGTMILTLSAVAVEVVILAIIREHEPSPTLVRDTIYSAVMLDMNGILGLAALIGGFKHGEQPYNDDSAKTYSVMILTAMGISMVVPEFVPHASWRLYSAFTIGVMLMLYGVFLRMQVGPHSYFFSYSYPEKKQRQHGDAAGQVDSNTLRSVATLLFGVALIGVLAELMSKSLSGWVAGSGAPPVLVGLLVAAISASPEILTALRSAMANRMQGVVNIALGASLFTVILTVPIMEALALYDGHPMQMGMTQVQTVMVFLTLVTAAINLNDGETNAIEGMTHFALFVTFIALVLMGL